jgi:hypothetical protein
MKKRDSLKWKTAHREAMKLVKSFMNRILLSDAYLEKIINILETVDQRRAAVDGPVTPANQEITASELRKIYLLAKKALKGKPARRRRHGT